MKNYLYYIYWLIRTWPYRWTFPKYKIMSIEETIRDIVTNNKSISRFGDGEFLLLLGVQDLKFQNQSAEISAKLLEVLRNRNPHFLVAIPDSLRSRKKHKRFARVYWLLFINTHGKTLRKLLDKNYYYGNANMTRLYVGSSNQHNAPKYFEIVKKIWANKEVLIVEGELSRLGVGNDLFSNAKSIQRLICPTKNAFEKYEDIKTNAIKFGAGKLILVALGPTATILCSDLCSEGLWTVDIGHIDVEYMWMLMGAKDRVSIPGRYVNESDNSEGFELDSKSKEGYEKSIALDLSK